MCDETGYTSCMKTREERLQYWKDRYRRWKDTQPPREAWYVSHLEALSETEVAYIAGIVDGEGCVMLTTNQNCTQLSVQVTMTHQPVIVWLAERLATKVSQYKSSPKPAHHKPQYSVKIVGRRAVALLARLLPYLIVKEPQARLGLEYGETIGQWPGAVTVPLTDAVRAQRLALKARMHELNGQRWTPETLRPSATLPRVVNRVSAN